MRKLYTLDMFREQGISRSAIRWGESRGRWRSLCRGVWGEGDEPASDIDMARAAVVASRGMASGLLAGCLLGLDAVDDVDEVAPCIRVGPTASNWRAGVRRSAVAQEHVVYVDGVPCTDMFQTLLDLAPQLDDLRWEQVLECVLRRDGCTVRDIEQAAVGIPGAARIRRVLGLRPPDAAPTESLLETLVVQLARDVPGLPPPVRQFVILSEHGSFIARIDLAWPDLGLFLELDGQGHKGQPVYDAHRQTLVIATTGWLVGRFTWYEVVYIPKTTTRRLGELLAQALRRAS